MKYIKEPKHQIKPQYNMNLCFKYNTYSTKIHKE